jgi:hypothetical protein
MARTLPIEGGSAPRVVNILVALQGPEVNPLPVLNELASVIERAPRAWVWRLRPHPLSSERLCDGTRLLGLPNVEVVPLEAIVPRTLPPELQDRRAFGRDDGARRWARDCFIQGRLIEMLKQSDVLVCYHSSSSYEAAKLGVPVIFLRAGGPSDLLASGAATYVEAVQDLPEAIERLAKLNTIAPAGIAP